MTTFLDIAQPSSRPITRNSAFCNLCAHVADIHVEALSACMLFYGILARSGTLILLMMVMYNLTKARSCNLDPAYLCCS